MKRMMLLAGVIAAFGVFTSVASATTTTWTASYDFSAGYGSVSCTGQTVVNKKYPYGKDVETCESTSKFAHMKAGREQKEFALEGGGSYSEWESDSGSGKKTTNYTYSVNKQLTRFKLVAIYSS